MRKIKLETIDTEVNEIIKEFKKGTYKIPSYQRGYVWDDDMTNKLLLSVLKGYPMGSILIWNQISNEKKELNYVIDGQQRTQTLMRILEHPMKFQNRETLSEIFGLDIKPRVVEALKKEMGDLNRDEFEIPINLIEDVEKKELPIFSLFSKVVNDKSKELDAFRMMLQFNLFISNLKSETFKIPVIKIKAKDDEVNIDDEIIDIFNIINTTGKALDKFEILAAKWSKHQINLNEQEITEIKKIYDKNSYEGVNTRVEEYTPAELFYLMINKSLEKTNFIYKLFGKDSNSKNVEYEYLDKMLWLLRVWKEIDLIQNETNFDEEEFIKNFNNFTYNDEYDNSLGKFIKKQYDEKKTDEFISDLSKCWELIEEHIGIIDEISMNNSLRTSISKNMFISLACQFFIEIRILSRTNSSKTYNPDAKIQLWIVKEILDGGFSKATTQKMSNTITDLSYTRGEISIEKIRELTESSNNRQVNESSFNDGFEYCIKFIILFAFKRYIDGASGTFDYDHIFPKAALIDADIHKNIHTIGNCGYLESIVNRGEKRDTVDKETCLSDRLINIDSNKVSRNLNKSDYENTIESFLTKEEGFELKLFEFMEKRKIIIIDLFLDAINPIKEENQIELHSN